MFAVVQIGSMLVRLACGTMRRVRAAAGWPIAKRGSAVAAAAASRPLRRMFSSRGRLPRPVAGMERQTRRSRKTPPGQAV
jgi:hypothetical protein